MKKQLIPSLASREFTTMSRNKDCATHQHINCEFLFIVKGNIINTVNDITITAPSGTIFFVNNNSTHQLKQTEADYEHRDIYISQKTIQKICMDYFDDNFYQYLMSTDRIIQIHVSPEIFSYYENRLKRNQTLYALYPEKKSFIKQSNLNIMISLLGILFEQLPTYPSSNQSWLDSFLERIQTPAIFTLPIQKIIRLSGYSSSYFSHQFSQTFNMSFKTYITRLKIDYSKLLLTASALSLTEIALTCGFSSQSHFTQIFKSLTGTTPYQYKKSH